MTPITTLLVSRDPSVTGSVQRLHDDTEYARLEVCGRFEKVPARLGRDVSVLLVHCGPGESPDLVRAALEAGDRALVTAAVVSGPVGEARAPAPGFGPYPGFRLPADLAALRKLLDETRARAERSAAGGGPVPSAAEAPLHGCEAGDMAGIHRVAAQATTILLTGETGSGKSMLAKYIHSASPRHGEPYLVIDCGALSGSLIESEMFGHVRGAFTGADRERPGKFAAAGVGTLVLDEVNSLPLPLQAKLLRAVEERVFEPVGSNRSEPLRARLIAVSNVPLEDEVRRERFRADLFYRLNVVEFRVPPLRERPATVIPLAHQLLRSSATAACQGVTAISPAALEAMIGHPWPGNVRELRNVIERAAALATGPVIQLADLPDSVRGHAGRGAGPVHLSVPERAPVPERDGAGEVSRILTVLHAHRNNRQRAAAELGISRVCLYKKLHRYGIFVRKGEPRHPIEQAVPIG